MSYILTYVRVPLATSDVQRILGIPATDKIHMKDRNHGLTWTKPNNGLHNTQHNQQPYIWILWYQNDQKRNKPIHRAP